MEFPGSLNRWDRYHIIPQLAVCKRLERPAVGQKIRSQQISTVPLTIMEVDNGSLQDEFPHVSSATRFPPFSTSMTVRESVAEVEWNVPFKDHSN